MEENKERDLLLALNEQAILEQKKKTSSVHLESPNFVMDYLPFKKFNNLVIYINKQKIFYLSTVLTFFILATGFFFANNTEEYFMLSLFVFIFPVVFITVRFTSFFINFFKLIKKDKNYLKKIFEYKKEYKYNLKKYKEALNNQNEFSININSNIDFNDLNKDKLRKEALNIIFTQDTYHRIDFINALLFGYLDDESKKIFVKRKKEIIKNNNIELEEIKNEQKIEMLKENAIFNN